MSKKLTISNMNAIVGTHLSPIDFTYKAKDGSEIVITIDPNISLAQISNFVDSVEDAVFTPDGDYIPEYRDLATFIAVIRELSNMPLPKNGDAVDLAACHKWMVATDLLEKLRDWDDGAGEWFYGIESLVTNKINFKQQEIMAKHQSNYTYFEGKLEELINTFSSIGEQFENLDLNEVMDTTRALASKTEAQLASAIIDINEAKQKKPAKKPAAKKST